MFEIIGELVSSLGIGGSVASLGILGAIALYGFRFAKLLSSASTVVLVVLAVVIVGTLLGWLELGAMVSDIGRGLGLAWEFARGMLA